MANRSLTSPKVEVKISATVRNVMDDGRAAQGAVNGGTADSLNSGVDANQANRAWQWKNKILANGATLVVDIFDMASFDVGAGLGNDIVGQTMSPIEEVVAIKIKNENAPTLVAGLLEIEPDSSNGWTPIGTHTVANGGALGGGGILLKYQPAEAGFNVTDASNHRILLTANGGPVTFSIYLLGRHDDEASSSSSSSSSSVSSSSSSSSSSSVSSSSSSSISSSSSSSSSSQSSSSSISTSSSSISASSSSISTSSLSSQS